jgi:hypothetical protein
VPKSDAAKQAIGKALAADYQAHITACTASSLSHQMPPDIFDGAGFTYYCPPHTASHAPHIAISTTAAIKNPQPIPQHPRRALPTTKPLLAHALAHSHSP